MADKPQPKPTIKTVELWEGYEVEVSDALFRDANYLSDFYKAQKEEDFGALTEMFFALTSKGKKGSLDIYEDVENHITEKMGYFDINELAEVVQKITDALPKVGNRAQRRSWMSRN